MTVLAKVCTKCGEGKVLDDFGRKSTGRYGREAQCKRCKSESRSQIGTDKNRVDQTIRVNWRVKARLKVAAQELGVTEKDLGGYALAAGLQAIKDGRLKLPKNLAA